MAIAHARPERFCTFTKVGATWQQVRGRMRLIRHRLAQEGYRWEWVWSVEPNPKGTGRHVHGWQRGSYVPQRVLSRIAVREGCGPVTDVRAWRQGADIATAYALKSITYAFKGGEGDSAAGFLAMNGHRLTHQSRGWWTAGGARDQEREAVRALFGDNDEWCVVASGHEVRVLAALRAGRAVSAITGPDWTDLPLTDPAPSQRRTPESSPLGCRA